MDIKGQFTRLLDEIGAGSISGSVYDTAWVARLNQLNHPLGHAALDWLRSHQLPDGSWGTSEILYHHERVVCTLAAMATLIRIGDSQDFHRIVWGKKGFDIHAEGMGADFAGETAGFELVAPVILADVNNFGLNIKYEYFLRLERERVLKLSALPDRKINRYFTPAFSLEMVADQKHLLDIENLLESNGSVACSSSATAWFYMNIEKNPDSLAHLQRVAQPDGTLPTIAPIDTFEIAWTLWNLCVSPLGEDPELLALCGRHLDFLEANWRPGKGTASLSNSSIEDGDATAVVMNVLHRFGRELPVADLLRFEGETHFRCFSLEANPSTSTNIHILACLKTLGYEPDSDQIEKILWFLDGARVAEAFWQDKWHFSPYYPTSRAVIAACGYCDEVVRNSIRWLLHTQRTDGGWGYQKETAEETAYTLQALGIWQQAHGDIPAEVFKKGGEWLRAHKDDPYTPLWIGKSLYTPPRVVESTILSALAIVENL